MVQNYSALFLNTITSSESHGKNNFLPHLSEKLKEFVIANMNMTDNMFSDIIIRKKEKLLHALCDKIKEEVSDYC